MCVTRYLNYVTQHRRPSTSSPQLQADIEAQRTRIQDIVAAMPVAHATDDFCLVDSTWLADWANAAPGDALTPIDNSELQCPHGALDPGAWSKAKRISTQSWAALHEMCSGGPAFGPAQLCAACCHQQLKAIVDRCVICVLPSD